MMKSFFHSKKMKYDGSQLRPLFAYENFKLSGPSAVSWIGACDVSLDHMVDFEDKIVKARIKSDLMLHFIIEYFQSDLFSAVTLQRLFAGLVKVEIDKMIVKAERENKKSQNVVLVRNGDDLYWGDKKLSISIASCSAVSQQIHFAINVVNAGTPVKTCALSDWKINPEDLSKKILKVFTKEYQEIVFATQKVKPL